MEMPLSEICLLQDVSKNGDMWDSDYTKRLQENVLLHHSACMTLVEMGALINFLGEWRSHGPNLLVQISYKCFGF